MPTHGAQQRASETSRAIQPCGTPAAARRHHKHGEPLDDACRQAFRRYHREYRRAARTIDAFRQRELAARARWEQRLYTDPARHERRRRQQREGARVRKRRIVAEFRDCVDPVVVDRLVNGEPAEANRAETRAAFHRLRTQGHTLTAACTQLRLSGSTGRRYEAASNASNVIEVAHTAGTDCLEETG